MSDASRHGHYVQRRLPHDKRTLALYGEKDDTGKYYRCWNCGFICNVDRDSLDTGEFGGSGVTVLDFAEINIGPQLGDDATSLLLVWEDSFVMLKIGQDDESVVNYRHNQYPYVIGGCPLCGCKNYR